MLNVLSKSPTNFGGLSGLAEIPIPTAILMDDLFMPAEVLAPEEGICFLHAFHAAANFISFATMFSFRLS